MTSRHITSAAALFFDGRNFGAVPLAWLQRVRKLFVEHNLFPILFNADGGHFEDADGYVLAEQHGKTVLWDATFPMRGSELLDDLQSGVVSTLHLDSPRRDARYRDDACLMISVSALDGMFYVGIDEDLVPSPAALLRRACEIADGLLTFRYGFAFTRSLHEHPASYAAGQRSFSAADAFDFIRRRKGWDRRAKTGDELWHDELMGPKRHLSGLFRDAYPANVLSESHVTNAALRTSGVGKLTDLGELLWLWELDEREIPLARTMLQECGLLIAPAV